MTPSTAPGEAVRGLPSGLLECLRRPTGRRGKSREVELIETHISWVFLTEQYAFKLKKPVRFDFLDFSTPELRRAACEQEVELNRRLAQGVYLGVEPVVQRHSGSIGIGGPGEVVDWLVKMKRLPASTALDSMLLSGEQGEYCMEQLAELLVGFYEQLPPVTITVDSYRQGIERHVMGNQEELNSSKYAFNQAELKRTHAAQLRILRLAPRLLDERVRNGRIVEGHGDLRPEHIYFWPRPTIIDCIEFSREYRTLDVADELAFLAMECERLGAKDLIQPVIERYQQQSSDQIPAELFAFYQTYRACVRAKVAAIRGRQLGGEEGELSLATASRYLTLADDISRRIGPPMLILVRGLPGVGKSTIAQTVCESLGCELLQTDLRRREIYGAAESAFEFQQGRYAPDQQQRVYDELHHDAQQLLSQGTSVVLDGTYLVEERRQAAIKLAVEHGAEFFSVHCECPADVAIQRIRSRAAENNCVSDTRPEFYEQQRLEESPELPAERAIHINTANGIVEPLATIHQALGERLFS